MVGLKLTLTEYAGFSPAYIYERARLRALSSKYEFDFKDFDFNNLTLIFFINRQIPYNIFNTSPYSSQKRPIILVFYKP
jgi:hypothetical protein